MEAFLIYLLKSAGILSLFLLIYTVFLKKETLFVANRFYLLSGIVGALLLPLLYFTKTVWVDPIPAQGFYQIMPNVVEEKTFSINWWHVASVIYSAGVLVMLTRFVIQLLSLKKLLNTHTTYQKEGILYTEIYDDIAPFSFGKHIAYNPKSHTRDDLQIILKHEEEHVKQVHTLDLIISNILVAFQWCNPFAWVYKNYLEQNLEFLADRQTLQNNTSKRDYQLAMVKVSARNSFPEVTTNFYQSFIKKRIIMLNKDASKTQNLWKLALIIPCLIAFIYTFNVKTIAQVKPEEIQSTTPQIETLASTTVEEIPQEVYASKLANVNNAKTQPKQLQNIATTNAVSETPSYISTNQIAQVKTIVSTILSSTTDNELDLITKKFKNSGVTVKFKNVKRKNGLITAIKVNASKGSNSSNFQVNQEDGITPVMISYNKDTNEVNVGNASNSPKNIHVVRSSNMTNTPTKIWVNKDSDSMKIGGNAKEYAFITYSNDSLKTHNNRRKIIVNSFTTDSLQSGTRYLFHSDHNDDNLTEIIINGKTISVDSLHADSHKIFIHDGEDHEESIFLIDSDDENVKVIKGKGTVKVAGDQEIFFTDNNGDSKEPKYFIDGKKATKEEVDKLGPEDVEKVDVTKKDGEASIHIVTKKD